MKPINHLVLAGNDLDAMRAHYADLGFTVTPKAMHPFGTGNAVVQLQGAYLELLSVIDAAKIPRRSHGGYSFAGFNRDYLARHEGFSMLVLETADAPADIRDWKAAGLPSYDPFEFSRMAQLPDGSEKRIGFSLAYTSSPAAPWLGHFACHHHAPDYFAQPAYFNHANGASGIADVWIVGDDLTAFRRHFEQVIGAKAVIEPLGSIFETASGQIILARPQAFEAAFGTAAPHPEDGPRLAAYTIRCASLDNLPGDRFETVAERLVLKPEHNFGTALAFIA